MAFVLSSECLLGDGNGGLLHSPFSSRIEDESSFVVGPAHASVADSFLGGETSGGFASDPTPISLS